ncbi:phage/plasmid primase [Mycoplasmopsis bovigenitalium]|uniref:phage/plasmid primase, P4 family n=1 Tax=Mycoplasmopsis bovigenitalium TaxID=2112 RepID=UPI00090B49FA|nr:phage/plasmid primase, P4 family [Mycoplasmopsis bovigenitalium]BAW18559.1 phage/plasmid primase [Mycoplasmopsis bovigenitalium]
MVQLVDNEALKNFLENESRFIVLNDDKTPKFAFKDKQTHLKLRDVYSESNLGLVLDNDYIVIDVDNSLHPQEAQKLMQIIEEYQWECNIMKTTRGMHFWFKLPEKIKNQVAVILPVGIQCDIKSASANSYVVIKHKGEFRKWVKFTKYIDKLPQELTPLSTQSFKNLPTPVALQEGSRRDNLFKRLPTLARGGFNQQRVFNLFSVINKLLFANPLPSVEIENIFKGSEQFFDKSEQSQFYVVDHNTGKQNLNLFSVVDYIIQKYKVVRYSEQLFFFNENKGIYELKLDREIQTIIVDIIPKLKVSIIKEIQAQILISTQIKNKIPEEHIIALNNCYYNLKTFRKLEVDSNLFVINKINVDYDPRLTLTTHGRTLQKFLSDITCNDLTLQKILLQFIGYCLTSSTKYQKALLIYGQTASNGKSTFLDMLDFFFSKNNVSYLGFEELSQRFATSSLIDKMINVGADISTDYVSEPSTFKKLVTGDAISAEFKGKDRFSFRNKAKLIFATNKLPATQDKSDGYFRRFLIVPFNNEFRKENRNIDRNIKERLLTKTNMMVLFRMATEALRELEEKGEFAESQTAKDITNDYIKTNNSINVFIENDMERSDEQIKAGEGFNNCAVVDKYVEYKRFCLDFGYKSYSLSKFKEEVLLYFKEIKMTTRKVKCDELIKEKFIVF